MFDEILKQISQLSRHDKYELFKVLERELAFIKNGVQLSLSDEDSQNIIDRHQDILKQSVCLIEFDDHLLHLKKSLDA